MSQSSPPTLIAALYYTHYYYSKCLIHILMCLRYYSRDLLVGFRGVKREEEEEKERKREREKCSWFCHKFSNSQPSHYYFILFYYILFFVFMSRNLWYFQWLIFQNKNFNYNFLMMIRFINQILYFFSILLRMLNIHIKTFLAQVLLTLKCDINLNGFN